MARIIKALLGQADDAAIAALKGNADNAARRIAYHGSPYDYAAERLVRMADGTEQWIVGKPGVLPDVPAGAEVLKDAPLGRFRLEKAGTGEGAAAYGAGAYLSDAKSIAKGYKEGLSGRRFKVGDTYIEPSSTRSTTAFNQTKGQNIAADALDDAFNAQSNSPAQYATNRLRWYQKQMPEEEEGLSEAFDVIAEWEKTGSIAPTSSGKLYTAEIPDESLMLDWDKPLSEQPEAIQNAVRTLPGMGYDDSMKSNGRMLYEQIADSARWSEPDADGMQRLLSRDEQRRAASEKLRSLGIPGMSYVGDSSGERNFVVFDDALIDIKEKGRIDPRLLAPAAGAAALAGYAMPGPAEALQGKGAKPGFMDYLKGAGDVVADTANAFIYPAAVAAPSLMDYAFGVPAEAMAQRRADRQAVVDYQPRTDLGRQWSQAGQDAVGSALGAGITAAPKVAGALTAANPVLGAGMYAAKKGIGPVMRLWDKLDARTKIAIQAALDATDVIF